MAQSVSNDALWQKLSEMDKRLENLSIQKSLISPISEQMENTDIKDVKDEIITQIKEQASLIGKHSDINFETDRKNIKIVNNNILRVLKSLEEIHKLQTTSSESTEPLKSHEKENEIYSNFRLFRIKKTSLIITLLSLLVFTLITFCMKQQNDYSLLNAEYYRKRIVIRTIQAEVDSLKNNTVKLNYKKNK